MDQTGKDRSHFSGTRRTIGLLTYGSAEPLNHLLWSGVAQAAEELDANLICFPGNPIRSPREFEAQANVVYDLVSAEVVDGLIIWSGVLAHHIDRDEMRRFFEHFYPLPVVNIGLPLEGIPGIVLDNYMGIREIAQHLVDVHAYRKMVYLRGPQNHPEEQDRYRAFADVLAVNGLPLDPERVLPGDFKKSSGHQAVALLLDQRQWRPRVDFDAILAANDMMAIGAMEALRERGIQIPEEVAIAGFDDAEESRYVSPPLSTVPFYAANLGKRGVEILIDILNGQATPGQEYLPTHAILRQSCGCPDPAIVQAIAATPSGERSSGEEHLALLHQQITTELLQIVDFMTPGAVNELWDRLAAEIAGSGLVDGSSSFLRTLEAALHQNEASVEHFSKWQSAISALRRSWLPHLTTPAALNRMENLCQQARVMISETAQRAQAYRLVQAHHQARLLSEINQRLSITLSLAELGDTLAHSLVQMGIPVGYLSLYEDPQAPATWSHLVVAFNAQEPSSLVPVESRFPSRQIVPSGMLPRQRRFSMVVEPLYFREDQLGFALLEAGPELEETCEILRQQLSGALKRTTLTERNIRLYNEAVEARKAAEEANVLKSRFLSMVSHELRTPLSLIIGSIEMILPEETSAISWKPETYRQDLSCIHASAQHLSRLIGDVLDLASSHAGELKLTYGPVDLGQVLHEAALLGKLLASEKGLAWKTHIPEPAPLVLGDRTRLRQVTINLISNAVKFTEKGEVALRMETDGSTVTVSISDTGMGIPPDDQPAIFDEFRRSQRSVARGYGGMGLGLAITRRLIELHAGSIGVDSTGEEGAGSTFYYTLPVMEHQVPDRESLAARQRTVLLLVEQASAAEQLQTHLMQRGFDVTTLTIRDEPDWVAYILQAPPAAIVLDFHPAAERGWELMKILKQDPAMQEIPVVFYSLAEEQNAGSILELDYMTKPLGSLQLAQTLRRLGLAGKECDDQKTILVVDDDPGILDIEARMLEEQLPACRVLRAHNGREALEIMSLERLHLVLLDLMMPEIDGFQVLQTMRTQERTRNVPVIVMTAQLLTSADMERLKQGVAAVLSKGLFSTYEVMAQVEAILNRSKRLGSVAQRIVRQASAYIHEHYPENLSRIEIARHLNVSEHYLTRCFRQEMGITPVVYLNRYRIRQAKTLLEQGETNVTEVALAVGFSDSNYFGRLFRREVGIAPGAYLQGKRPTQGLAR
jgi:signal transduction histidine kinase/DNA-binding LacI/PurR family transcriptional regulator/AraC-like DNA-binding protein